MAWTSNTAKWMYAMRRVLATLCIAILAVVIGQKVVFGANGAMEWRAKRAEFLRLQKEIGKATIEHQVLEDRVQKLQTDPNTIVKEAREKLGYVMPGEVVLVQPQPKVDVRNNSDIADNMPSASANPKK
jgi:cell division protein FtsB